MTAQTPPEQCRCNHLITEHEEVEPTVWVCHSPTLSGGEVSGCMCLEPTPPEQAQGGTWIDWKKVFERQAEVLALALKNLDGQRQRVRDLERRLTLAEAVVTAAKGWTRGHNARGSDGPCECSVCDALALYRNGQAATEPVESTASEGRSPEPGE